MLPTHMPTTQKVNSSGLGKSKGHVSHILLFSVDHSIINPFLSRTRSFLQSIRWFRKTEERQTFSNNSGYTQIYFCISCNRNEGHIRKQGTAAFPNQQPEWVGKIFRLLVPSSLPSPCLLPKRSWFLKLVLQLDHFIPALIFSLSSWGITT